MNSGASLSKTLTHYRDCGGSQRKGLSRDREQCLWGRSELKQQSYPVRTQGGLSGPRNQMFVIRLIHSEYAHHYSLSRRQYSVQSLGLHLSQIGRRCLEGLREMSQRISSGVAVPARVLLLLPCPILPMGLGSLIPRPMRQTKQPAARPLT